MNYEEFKQNIKVPMENCPVSRTLTLLEGKWTSKVIYELEKVEQLRFSELKKRLPGITNTMLSSTLKKLEDNGIVDRIQYMEIPLHVEYSLTKAGREMPHIYFEMAKWGIEYLPTN